MKPIKPVVYYIDVGNLTLGQPAMVLPINHPSPFVSNQKWVRTTPVSAIRPGALGPRFETKNTIYVAAGDFGQPIESRSRRAEAA